MTTPAAPVIVAVSRGELRDALANAAKVMAQKGAQASDAVQARDFGAAALSYVQAVVLVDPPPQAPGSSNGTGSPQNGSQGSSSTP